MRSQLYFMMAATVIFCLVVIQLVFSMKVTADLPPPNKNESDISISPRKLNLNRLERSHQDQDQDQDQNERKEPELEPEQAKRQQICDIYMAPSTIPNAGMGVFTARKVQKRGTIMPQDTPLIPITDMFAPNEFRDAWTPLFRSYVWSGGSSATAELNYEADNTVDFQLSLGMFPNFHTLLHNLSYKFQDDVYDDSAPGLGLGDNLTIRQNPGAGAYSNHVGRDFIATRKLDAGDELFLNYGEDYLNSRSYMSHVPREADYHVAADILMTLFQNLKGKRKMFRADTTHSERDEFTIIIDETMAEIKESYDSDEDLNDRVLSILPSTFDEVRAIYHATKDDESSEEFDSLSQSLSFAVAKHNIPKRDVSWLVRNGICLDNIMPGVSDIPTAGQGAKARRHLKEGSVITPAPLLQIFNRDALSTHQVNINHDGSFDHNYEKKAGSQLLLNYCYGHPNSSLLLCPTTNTILINHCSTDCGGSGMMPNAKIQWGKDEITKKWLDMSWEEMMKHTEDHGLSFDFVATRDIEPGEEIYIDYGKSWEDAWNAHTSKWEQRFADTSDESYYSTTVLNRLDEPVEDILTKIKSDNPTQIFTACLYWDDREWLPRQGNLRGVRAWRKFNDDKIKNIYSSNGKDFLKENRIRKSFNSWWPCTVVNRDDEEGDAYTVRIFQSPNHQKTEWSEMDYPRFLHDFPRSSIRFFHVPYSSPMHMKEAFRHYIEIPSEMFPSQWLDRLKSHDKFHVGNEVSVGLVKRGRIAKINEDNKRYDIIYNNGVRENGVKEDEIRLAMKTLSGATSHPFHNTKSSQS